MTRVPPHVPAPSSGYHVLPVRTIALIGLTGLLTLLADPSFQKTGAQAQYDMLAALATRPADLESKELRRPDTELVAQYVKLAGRPEVQKLDPPSRRR